MEKLIVRGVNKMVFEIDPVTLEPKTCAYYDAWCFSDPEKYVKYINHAEWRIKDEKRSFRGFTSLFDCDITSTSKGDTS
jgi:hypothetical protein